MDDLKTDLRNKLTVNLEKILKKENKVLDSQLRQWGVKYEGTDFIDDCAQVIKANDNLKKKE